MPRGIQLFCCSLINLVSVLSEVKLLVLKESFKSIWIVDGEGKYRVKTHDFVDSTRICNNVGYVN